jgi:hypothetical protein
MQKDTKTLIEELLSITESASKAVEKFKGLPAGQLNFKRDPRRWSVLECIEHLNRYSDYYLPEIEKALLSGKRRGPAPFYKSGLVGNYFAGLMRVRDGKVFRMRTPSEKNPAGSQLSISTLDRFLEQQELLKSLLHRARVRSYDNESTPFNWQIYRLQSRRHFSVFYIPY